MVLVLGGGGAAAAGWQLPNDSFVSIWQRSQHMYGKAWEVYTSVYSSDESVLLLFCYVVCKCLRDHDDLPLPAFYDYARIAWSG